MARHKRIELTRLESETMSAIWDNSEAVSVRQVMDAMNRGRKRKLAYNTVQTVMTILKDKGYLKLAASTGRAHRFVATISRSKAGTSLIKDLARRLFGKQLQPMIHHIIDDAELTPQQLQELRDWVDEKLTDVQEKSK